jgi:hypothetical protein
MDFVASRAKEKTAGWRTRIGQFLKRMGVIVFDPWNKPEVRGLHEYGHEGETTTDQRRNWTWERGPKGASLRSGMAESFWPALHVDLRMVDTSDFVICYCPTNVYSVGTPHEIIVARQQRKPVLFISPYVDFPAFDGLREHLQGDARGTKLLEQLTREVPIKPNPNACPSLWYIPLIGGEEFFDGFGFDRYRNSFGWKQTTSIDQSEKRRKPLNPLLSFLARLNEQLPRKWDRRTRDYVTNDDWLLWNLGRPKVQSRTPTRKRRVGGPGDR